LETLEIQAEAREVGNNDRLAGCAVPEKIPGVLYGPKTRGSFGLNKREFRVVSLDSRFAFGPAEVRIAALAAKSLWLRRCNTTDQREMLFTRIFNEVDLTAKIQVRVALHFVGKAVGVVRGGILQPMCAKSSRMFTHGHTRIFNVEVSRAGYRDAVHIEDLQMPEDVTAIYETNLP